MAREGVDDLVCADVVVEIDVLAIIDFWNVVFGDCDAFFDGSADDEGVGGNFFGYLGSGDYGLAGFCDGGEFAHQDKRVGPIGLERLVGRSRWKMLL